MSQYLEIQEIVNRHKDSMSTEAVQQILRECQDAQETQFYMLCWVVIHVVTFTDEDGEMVTRRIQRKEIRYLMQEEKPSIGRDSEYDDIMIGVLPMHLLDYEFPIVLSGNETNANTTAVIVSLKPCPF